MDHSPVLLLGGARQVGKTTLVKEVAQKHPSLFINLYESIELARMIDQTESFDDFERLLWRQFDFRPGRGILLVIDEAQEARRLGRWIRFFKEKWVGQKVVILGSILSNLFEEDQPYPVGRVVELTLRPFCFSEFLLAAGKKGLHEILHQFSLDRPLGQADEEALVKPYLDYLQTGGMPEIVVHHFKQKIPLQQTWQSLIRQYALDVERYLGETFRSLFLTVLERLAAHTCQPAKMSQIVSTDSPFYRRLPQMLEVLEKWHLVIKSRAKTRQPESASQITSRRYLFDTGLTNYLIHSGQSVSWHDRSEIENIIYGKLQENFVCQEILSTQALAGFEIDYYRDTKNSKEIDFIVRHSGGLVPVEVKSGRSVSRNNLLQIARFAKEHQSPFGVMIYNGTFGQTTIEGMPIFTVPPFLVGRIFDVGL